LNYYRGDIYAISKARDQWNFSYGELLLYPLSNYTATNHSDDLSRLEGNTIDESEY